MSSGIKITDDLTDKLSKQRRWQIRQVRKGKCIKCNAKLATSYLCEKHRLLNNQYQNEANKRRLATNKKRTPIKKT